MTFWGSTNDDIVKRHSLWCRRSGRLFGALNRSHVRSDKIRRLFETDE